MDTERLKECLKYRDTADKLKKFLSYWNYDYSCVIITDVNQRRRIELPEDLSSELIEFLTKAKQEYYNKFDNFEIIKKGE